MEDLYATYEVWAEVERTDWPDDYKSKTREIFRKRLSGAVCKPLYAAWGGNSPGGER